MSKRYVLGESAARRLAQMLRGKGEVSSRPGAAAGITVDSEYVAPFTVQWAQSVGDAGAWIIWLPGGELVTLPGGVTINPSESLTAAGGDYPAGWYVLTGSMLSPSAGGTLYLNVTLGDSPSAVFSASAATPAENVIAIPVCSARVDSSTGARGVEQYVTSEIVISGDGKVEVDNKSVDWRVDAQITGSGSSAGSVEHKSLEIKGWKTQAAAASSLVAEIGLPVPQANEGAGGQSGESSGGGSSGSGSSSSREVVVRNGPDGSLEYLPLGEVDLPTLSNLVVTNGVSPTTLGKIVANRVATITLKRLSAGPGITVTEVGNTIVIGLADGVIDSNVEGASTGYTGTRSVLGDVDYNPSTHQLRRRYISERWSDGRMVDQTLMPWESYHQAVEES